jgi:hypothetical protein
MPSVRADIADCPFIINEEFSIMITVVFILDRSFVSAGDESKIIYSNDVSLIEISRRTRSENDN